MKLTNACAQTPSIAASITPALHVEHLSKVFNDMTALSSIDFSLKKGEILALLGPSGCGKTTLLRCIAGLLEPSSGRILIDGEVVVDERCSAVPEKRRLGMVFQDYALWPHMTVAENIAFPLSMRGMPKSERREKVAWALQVVGLEHLADRSPDTLSGGQQQRIALARAIVAKPRLLLMDEPLSNLDQGLRDSLAIEIRALIKQLNLTAVFVTHDQHEAFAMADQVAILQQGRLQQFDTAEVLYRTPATPSVAEFLDAGVLLKGTLTEQGLDVEKGLFVNLPFHASSGYQGEVTLLMPRASLSVNSHSGVELQHAAIIFTGEHYQLSGLMGGKIPIRLQSSQRPEISQSIYLNYEGDWLHAWDADDKPITLMRHTDKKCQFNLT
ncbi:ABC transporter ATP-binding protein [Nitrincola sp. A-D6]|uniref:ABC transporter ATP-binding protein n=1 Tax=Nitrincola sp. A-D6 TaxID=1545442 RepID=UPI0009DED073|nr:ABC transporter ATP-binding protein [Nitrincola sp. A-D6]